MNLGVGNAIGLNATSRRQGKVMTDTTPYLQMPMVNFDTIVLECIITSYGVIIDAQVGLVDGWVNTELSKGNPNIKTFVNNVEVIPPYTNHYYKHVFIKLVMPNVVNDDVAIFSHFNNTAKTFGKIYSIKYYLAGNLVHYNEY